MGFGYEELAKRNPRLIYAVGTGFGLTGPYSHKGGQDVLAQAMSGVMARARRSEPAALGLFDDLRRLFGRHASRPGRSARAAAAAEDRARPAAQRLAARFDARRADAGSGRASDARARGELGRHAAHRRVRDLRRRARHGRRLQGRSDRRHRHGARICRRSRTIRASRRMRCRSRTRRRCMHIFRERFKSDTTAHWLARLEAQDLLCAPVRTLAEALADEQAAINGMVIECDGEVETRARRRLADPSRGCAGHHPHSAGRPRPAHRRGARRDRAARASGRRASCRCRSVSPSPTTSRASPSTGPRC